MSAPRRSEVISNASRRQVRKDQTGPLFVPVAPERTSKLIALQIRQLILSGRLAMGERLPSERDLAAQLNVSRVTVRHALRTLEAQGLLKIRLGACGGAFVTAPTAEVTGEQIGVLLVLTRICRDDVAEARLLLESSVVGLAVRRHTSEDIAALRSICDRAEAAVKMGYEVTLSREFHATLARAAHNQALELITASFRGPLWLSSARASDRSLASQERSVAEHVALVDAVEARDLARAQKVLVQHIGTGRSPDIA